VAVTTITSGVGLAHAASHSVANSRPAIAILFFTFHLLFIIFHPGIISDFREPEFIQTPVGWICVVEDVASHGMLG
jgi:hypothetical protein